MIRPETCELLCLDLPKAEAVRASRPQPGRSDKLVSHHARALRVAGLAGSRREGKMVMYFVTEAGRELLGTIVPAAVSA
jgi:ArsR family transcriptional regulator, lead/cadmium/zinc/bismuth-responsive transcriptional repressor